jgi:uncharacterized protein (DUF2147 family)
MKRFGLFAVLMLLGSPADAGSYSFVIGGHHIHVEASRHCRSPACVSLSAPGLFGGHHWRDGDDDVDAAPERAAANPPVSPPVPAPAPVQTQAAACPPIAAAPAIVKPAAPAPQPMAAPPLVQAAKPASPSNTATTTASVAPLAAATADAARPAPAPQVAKVESNKSAPAAQPETQKDAHDDLAQTPLGDWRTEGNKGTVRIDRCGSALCGYSLDPSSHVVGEAVLINMKPKAAGEWSGNIYSRASGDTFYGTMAMQGANSLRVEACALGKYFCSGNLWSRIGAAPAKLVSYRQMPPVPGS